MFKQRNPKYEFSDLRDGVRSVVSQFDARYWQEVDDARAFPEAFVNALTQAGWLSALIPEEYGGSGLGLAIVREIVELHAADVLLLPNPAGRGTVFDRKGEAMTANQECYRLFFYVEDKKNAPQIIEKIVENDEAMMTAYLDGNTPDIDTLKKIARKAVIENEIFPVFAGSALKNKGVQLVLDAVASMLETVHRCPAQPDQFRG